MVKLIKKFFSFLKDSYFKRYLIKKGVVGIVKGTKVSNGIDTGEKCFKFYVQKKMPLKDIPQQEKIPKSLLLFFKTDVEELEMPKAHVDSTKYRPIQGGCEIGVQSSPYVGTAGNIYYREEVQKDGKAIGDVAKLFLPDHLKKHFNMTTKKKYYLGTNLHVGSKSILENPVGLKITQPGGSSYVVGKVVDYVPISSKEINEFDECIIELDKSFQKEISEDIIKVGKISGFKEPKVGMKLHKYGRTTSYTTGKIVSVGMYLNIDFGDDGVISFKDLVMIEGDKGNLFSDKGDSGSLALDMDNNAVVRINSGNGFYSFGIPFVKVLDKIRYSV